MVAAIVIGTVIGLAAAALLILFGSLPGSLH